MEKSRYMSTLPSISIVTPSFNQGRYLKKTIESVVQQNYPHLEYIIMDGGSTDESVSIIKEYESFLSYWQSKPDGGQSRAIHEGFKKASGDIFFWIASDDFLLPRALEKVGRFFAENQEVEVISGGCYFIDEKDQPLQSFFPKYTLGVAASYQRFVYYEQDGVAQPATFFSSAAYRNVGGINPDLHFAMDLDLYIRLAKRKRFSQLPELLSTFRLHSLSKTSNDQAIRKKEQREILQNYTTPLQRLIFWYPYRFQSLFRKMHLLIKEKTGSISL